MIPEFAQPGNGDEYPLPRVALLYRRNVQPDQAILDLLEAELKARGFPVFVDRHMQIGIAWATEIERQIREAGAVIPLLSPTSLQSEMLEHEILLAHRAAGEQGGRPRLLPIRIGHEGVLPPVLAGILDPLQYLLIPAEGGRVAQEQLVAAVVAALRSPSVSAVATETGSQKVGRSGGEPAGGAVPLESAFYVERRTDADFRAALTRRDSLVLLKGARQMGKTSLLARGLDDARQTGARVALLDLQTLSSNDLASPEALYRAFAETLCDQLDLPVPPGAIWSADRSPAMNLERYLRREALGALGDTRLIWALDEVDRLFSCPFGSEVFGLFRSWHNRRSLDPGGPWSRLTLAIAYATEAHLFITDLNQSPFNVGTRLVLEGFTPVQVAQLNRRYADPLPSDDAILRFHALLGGQPYLTRRGLDEIAARCLDIATFEAVAGVEDGIYGDHLRRILVSLSQDPILLDAMRVVLAGQPCPSGDAFYRLRSAGILTGDSQETAAPRCRLYAEYLAWHLFGGAGRQSSEAVMASGQGESALETKIARAELEADRYRRQVYELAAANERIHAQNEALLKQAVEDPLTGLANRRQMTDWLHQALAEAKAGASVAVALIDADYFKQINDRFSHPVGDRVLRTLAGLMRDACASAAAASERAAAPQDVPAVRLSRFGGEEFLAIFSLSAEDSLHMCESVRTAVENYDWESVAHDMSVTVSIGVCIDPHTAVTVEEVLSRADRKLYEAKRAGRNRVES